MLPNLLTATRIVLSPVLVVLAYLQQPIWFIVLAVLLVLTEWLDGFLARRWHLESALGARLDTIADAVFYSALLGATIVFQPEVIAREAIWICCAVGSYALSWIASWIKFGRLPSYHTWAAKGVWGIVGVGIICLLFDITPWPFRAAMMCVMLTNIEAVLITLTLKECRVDVPSLWHARKLQPPSDEAG